MNGYSGYFPPHYYALGELARAHDTRILRALSSDGPLGIIIDHEGDQDGALRGWVSASGARLITSTSSWSSFVLDRSSDAAPPDMEGAPLAIRSVDSYPSPPHAPRAIDGDLVSRWSGGVQQQSAGYTIELAEASHVGRLVTLLGGYVTDFPRKLRVNVSSDAHDWHTVFEDDTALQAYFGAVRHPREAPVVIPIDRDDVRFIQLIQVGFSSHDWSIAEVRVPR